MTTGTDRKKAVHPRNTLNALTGTEWIKFTRSWFVCDSKRYWKNRRTELHPARYPEEMVAEFVEFFTRPGEWVLDPFAGSGATLVACRETRRNAVGVEINARYVAIMRERLAAISGLGTDGCALAGDASDIADPVFWQREEVRGLDLSYDKSGLPQFDFIMTSPPYWNMLRKSRGGVESKQKQRGKRGLDTYYSESEADLGNIQQYEEFVERLGQVCDKLRLLLRTRRYMVVVVQNLRTPEGGVKPLAWDLARRIARTFQFQGERIWCQNTKPLGIWGYPRVFVPNYHHHYCLVFRNASQ